MQDLELSLQRVWHSEVRPLVSEAMRCYNAGSTRACVVMTWVAVCADITAKIVHLAEDGDGKAKVYAQELSAAQQQWLSKTGISAMQDFERTILDAALDLELIGNIAQRDLERLREDRHLCAHPSPHDGMLTHSPLPEIARGHLAVALDALLLHPPLRGMRLLDAFRSQVTDPLYSSNPTYILSTFYDDARDQARLQILTLAAKHALLELPAPLVSRLTS